MKILTAILFLLGPGKNEFYFLDCSHKMKIIPKIVFPMAEKKITVLIAISRDDDGNEVSQFTTTLGNSREEGRDPCIIQNVSTHTSLLPGLPPEV